MRVLECNACGETLSAASDQELALRLLRHVEQEHPSMSYDERQARATVAREAYEASDS